MRKTVRPFLVGALAVPALLPLGGQAAAQDPAGIEDARVTVSPDCAGTVSVDVMPAALPRGDMGVAIALRFAADKPDPACSVTATVNWRNDDAGKAGGQDLTVSSVPDPASDSDDGYVRVTADTGPGKVVVTASTNPGEESVTI